MENEKAGGYISKLIFNTGSEININRSDIVIFVGPNNAGKSQSLKDIYNLSSKKLPSTVISDIEIKKYSGDIVQLLDSLSNGTNSGGIVNYNVLGNNMHVFNHTSSDFINETYYGGFRNLFVANLDTDARLTICKPVGCIPRDGAKNHPIHYAAFEGKYRKWLSDNFEKAFNVGIIPNTHFGSIIPLCMGNPVQLEGEYSDEQERSEAYSEILATYRQVQKQGDGIKSFTGILLYLMLDYFCTFLIDEPESFLHPPQARIMGQIIGESLNNSQQAFISTHSEDIIKGLMEVCPERIKIVRITRDGDTNSFSVLDNSDFIKLWHDPLLKYSNIMASLFHRKVVLCESDSDCKMYSIIEGYIKHKQAKYSETLFIHCGGKHRIPKILSALRALDVEVKVIVDMDVLNDETVFRRIIESCDIDYSLIQSDYNIIASNLHSAKEKVDRNEAGTRIEAILNRTSNKELSGEELAEIRGVITTISKWNEIKKSGIAAIPSGDATSSYIRINEKLMEAGIFVVPVGELEGFVKEVGGHGSEWVDNVLEKYKDLDDNVYKSISQFIESLNL